MDSHTAKAPSRTRNVGVDVIRTLAVFCVIGVHALPQTVPLSMGIGREDSTAAARIVTQFIQMICQLGVPLFIAITGYLMLHRDYSRGNLGRFVRHNLLPVVVSFEFWNIVTAIFEERFISGRVTVRGIIESALFLGETPMSHMWYLQMIVGAYVALPLIAMVLRKVRDAGADAYLTAFVGLLFVYRSIVPTVQQLAGRSGYDLGVVIKFMPIVSDLSWILFPLLIGYAAQQGLFKRLPYPLTVTLFVLSLALLTADGYWYLMNGEPGRPALPAFTTNDSLILFTIAMIFAVVEGSHAIAHMPGWLAAAFRCVAQQSFGTYVIHFPIIMMFAVSAWRPMDGNWANCALYFAISFAVAFASSLVLSKVPIVGPWLLLVKNAKPQSQPSRAPRHASHKKVR